MCIRDRRYTAKLRDVATEELREWGIVLLVADVAVARIATVNATARLLKAAGVVVVITTIGGR